LKKEETPDLIVKETITHFGQIDVLINNAGLAHSSKIMETDTDIWNKLFKVNARAPFFLCKAAVPFLKQSEKPVIINISSVVGFKGYKGQAAYASSKHALSGFTNVYWQTYNFEIITSFKLQEVGGISSPMEAHPPNSPYCPSNTKNLSTSKGGTIPFKNFRPFFVKT